MMFLQITRTKARRAFSLTPETWAGGEWVECSPATSPGFSATAYFFGRDLYESLHVPVGLIASSWDRLAFAYGEKEERDTAVPADAGVREGL